MVRAPKRPERKLGCDTAALSYHLSPAAPSTQVRNMEEHSETRDLVTVGEFTDRYE